MNLRKEGAVTMTVGITAMTTVIGIGGAVTETTHEIGTGVMIETGGTDTIENATNEKITEAETIVWRGTAGDVIIKLEQRGIATMTGEETTSTRGLNEGTQERMAIAATPMTGVDLGPRVWISETSAQRK